MKDGPTLTQKRGSMFETRQRINEPNNPPGWASKSEQGISLFCSENTIYVLVCICSDGKTGS